MVQLGIWLIGEFGEHLLYGTTLAADDTPIQVDELEVIELFEKVMQEHKQKIGERSEVIVEYALTALSKLTVRFTKSKNRIVELVEGCTESSKIEIQQRACEYLELMDARWDTHRGGILEFMPYKGDENMLADVAGRDIVDEEEDGSKLFSAGNATAARAAAPKRSAPEALNLLEPTDPQEGQRPPEAAPTADPAGGNLLDLMGLFDSVQLNVASHMGGAPVQAPTGAFGGGDLLGGVTQ